jgi:hypothetical protein
MTPQNPMCSNLGTITTTTAALPNLSPAPIRQENVATGFKGMTYDASFEKWNSRISVDGNMYHMGYYQLQNDAALAYDEGIKILKSGKIRLRNFETKEKYLKARADEIKMKGLQIYQVKSHGDIFIEISSQVRNFMKKLSSKYVHGKFGVHH